MKDRHIQDFKVQNFKKFDSLEVSNLGHFNLVFGDNNVGKTIFLESLTVSSNIYHVVNNFLSILKSRGLKSKDPNLLLTWLLKQPKQPLILDIYHSDNQHSQYEIAFKPFQELSDEEKEIIEFDKGFSSSWSGRDLIGIYTLYGSKGFIEMRTIENLSSTLHNNFEENFYNYLFIPVNHAYSSDLADYYSKAIQPNKTIKIEFINSLKNFIPNLEDIEIQVINNQAEISIRETTRDHLLPLASYGFGTIKVFRILIGLFISSKNSPYRLMIDEIDVGVYHKRLKLFWKVILLTAKNWAYNFLPVRIIGNVSNILKKFLKMLICKAMRRRLVASN